MFRPLGQRAGKNIFATAKRGMAAGSPLNGNATSPHYADFGYGANQMLPFHEMLKNPIPYKWTPRPRIPQMHSGHNPHLHEHQVFTQATGHDFSIVAGVDHMAENAAKRAVSKRIMGTLSYFTLFGLLAGYEIWMWDGLQFPQQPIWDELRDTNTRLLAHSIQWEKSWREIQHDATPAELFQIINNRPFYTNNPYRFSAEDLAIADKNVSYRAIEPIVAAVEPELYRKQTNYIIFYSQLLDQLAKVESAKDIETKLSEWLFTQDKFTVAELQEILEFAPQWKDQFGFHQKAVFDEKNNQVVFFEGRHRATVEEALKETVPSIKATAKASATAFTAAQPLLVDLIKNGPVAEMKSALLLSCDGQIEDYPAREAVLGFLVADVNKEQQAKLQKVAQQVLESTDKSLATFQANAKGLGLPVPAAFSTSAINFAIAQQKEAV